MYVYLKNCGVKPSSASIEASCAHRAPKDPYPHRPAIHEKVGKVGAYARRQAALRATVIPILQRERAADHVDEDAKLQPKVHNKHAIDKAGEAEHDEEDAQAATKTPMTEKPRTARPYVRPNTMKRMPEMQPNVHDMDAIDTKRAHELVEVNAKNCRPMPMTEAS